MIRGRRGERAGPRWRRAVSPESAKAVEAENGGEDGSNPFQADRIEE